MNNSFPSTAISADRISTVRIHPIKIGRKMELLPKTSHGSTQSSEYVIIEIETHSGIIGVGEVTCSVGWNGEEAIGSADLLMRKIGPILEGLLVDDWQSISRCIEPWVRYRPFLRAAIEMACLDAEGKRRGLNVAEILGGIRRTEFSTKIVLPARESDVVQEMAKIALHRGAECFKVKVGLDLVADRNRLEVVRDIVGNRPILVDANEGWRPDEESEILRLISDFEIAAVEQPYPRRMVKESAALQVKTESLLMADESVWTIEDVIHIAESGSFKVVSLYPGKLGGIRTCLKAAEIATELELGVSLGSNLETGIGSALMAHFLAVAPALSSVVPNDLIGPLYFEEDMVRDSSWISWSGASLPVGSGLGVNLDRSALDACKVSVTI
jgi:L-alanine-DL-glutamate epimerase-like enolase superfamily enzyme